MVLIKRRMSGSGFITSNYSAGLVHNFFAYVGAGQATQIEKQEVCDDAAIKFAKTNVYVNTSGTPGRAELEFVWEENRPEDVSDTNKEMSKMLIGWDNTVILPNRSVCPKPLYVFSREVGNSLVQYILIWASHWTLVRVHSDGETYLYLDASWHAATDRLPNSSTTLYTLRTKNHTSMGPGDNYQMQPLHDEGNVNYVLDGIQTSSCCATCGKKILWASLLEGR